jgi:hypothetical protein
MALAALGGPRRDGESVRLEAALDPGLLAAVALEHAQAGCRALALLGPGGVTPEAVAHELAARARGD